MNKNDVEQFYDYLDQKETEVRAIIPNGSVKIVHVNNKEDFVKECQKYNGEKQVYCGINERKHLGTLAIDVLKIQRMFIDMDAIRKRNNEQQKEYTDATEEEKKKLDKWLKNQQATKKELQECALEADKVVNYFQEKFGAIANIRGMSGNGLYLSFNLDLDVSYENNVKEFLRQLQKKFNNDKIKIDEIGDLPRIIKVLGTKSIKGKNTEERPHRLSKIIDYNGKEICSKLVEHIKNIKEQNENGKVNFSGKLTAEQMLKMKTPDDKQRMSCIKKLLLSNVDAGWDLDATLDYVSHNNTWEGYDAELTKKICLEHPNFKKYLTQGKLKKLTEEPSEYCGITKFRQKTKIGLKQTIGTVYSNTEVNGAIHNKEHYQILSFTFGDGKCDKKHFLIKKPYEAIVLGQNDLYLRKVPVTNGKTAYLSNHWPNKRILQEICKEQDISTKDEDGATLNITKLLERISERQESKNGYLLFVETNGISNEDFEKITVENWPQLLKDYLNEGVETSHYLDLVFKDDLLEPLQEMIEPNEYMPYQPNELIYTNSKAGKTTKAMKTSRHVEEATPANLLGFSTANITVKGSLNNQTKKLSIDEVQEEKNDEIYGRLSTYMEQGKTEIPKGKETVKVRGYAPIRWMGNPKTQEREKEGNLIDYVEKQDLFQQFSDCLTIISTNNEAFGGRIALIMFRLDLEPSPPNTSNKLSIETIKQNEAIVETVKNKLRKPFTKLYFNQEILNWLDKQLNKNYLEQLKDIEGKASIQNIKEFISGHRKYSKRHVRGKALRLAVIDKAIELINEELDITKLLILAEDYLKEIEEQNLESILNLIDIASKDKTIITFNKKRFAELAEHFTHFLTAIKISEYNATDLEQLKEFIAGFETIKMSKETLLKRVTKNLSRTNAILSNFGVRVRNNGSIEVFNKSYFECIWISDEK